MAIIKSFSPFQNLSNFQTFLVDENPLSDYFRITEFKETFTGGKNGFLIEGSEFLKETTEVKIELLDVEGNPIYFEPGDGIPEYYEGTSKLVSVHVYDDTPIGLGKITILGELKNYVNENGSIVTVPQEWKGVYNVKWERTFKVNKNLSNEDIVRFYKRPVVNIDELVKPIFTKSVNQVTDNVSTVSGVPQLPNSGTDLTNYRAGTSYKLIRSSGTWDIDVDENTINVDVNGTTYSPTIIEVLNGREVLVDIPYAKNNIVQSFLSQSYSVTYTDFQNETIGESSLTGSFAKIDITQLKTFVGDVARVKVFRKSRNSSADFQFVQESRLESTELLRDITTSQNTELSYGRFDETNLSTYWTSSTDNHPISVNSDILSQAVKVNYDTNVGGVHQLITSQSFSISKDVEYTLNFRTLLSGSITDDKYIKAYFSGSYLNGNGDETQFTQSFVDTTPDGSFVVRKNITENIIAERSIDAKLVFEFKGDDWYISNVSLRNAQDTSFSPDEFTLIQDIPRKLASETFDFRFEFYDINNNYIPVNVIASKTFNGGNDFNTTSKLLTFESDRNAFRYSSGSIRNPENQQIQFKTTAQNLTGSILFTSQAFDTGGLELVESEWIQYPGLLSQVTPAGALITIDNFEGIYDTASYGETPYVGSIIYTASLENLEEFETIYRLEDGDNAPQLIVTSNANQFIYEPTTLSPKPNGQSITVRAQRKNLASLITPLTINKSDSNGPDLNFVSTQNGIDTYTISALQFSSSFEQNNFDEVTYSFTGSDVFGNEQYDEITLSKVINFDGISVVLSNESTTFSANSTGEIINGLGASSGSVQMYIGSTQIQHDDEIGGRSENTFNITSSIGENVTPTDLTPNTSDYSISSFENSKDSGSLTLTIDYLAGDSVTSQTFQKVVSYTKAKKAPPNTLITITPQSQTVTSSSLAVGTPLDIEISAVEGVNTYSYASSLSDNTFNISSITGGSDNSDGTFTPNSPTGGSTQGSVTIGFQNSEGSTGTQTLTFDVSTAAAGPSGSNGESGSTGPGIVFRGLYNPATSYQFDESNGRRDSVLYNDIYYVALQPSLNQAPTGLETDNTYWQSLGTQDFFVAAKIAIFEDSYIQNTLNVGTNGGGTGDSANITINGGSTNPYISINQSGTYGSQGYDVDGIFMGMDGGVGKLSLKNGAGNYLRWSGTALEISGDLNFSNGDSISQNGDFTLANGDLTYDGATFNFSADLDLNSTNPSDGDFSDGGIYLSTDGWISAEEFYIDSDGTAKFGGELSAATGTFGGKISAGGILIGTDVSSTRDGIYIDANNYWLNGSGNRFVAGNANNRFVISETGAIGVNVQSQGMEFYNTSTSTQGMTFSSSTIFLKPVGVGSGDPGSLNVGAGTIQGNVNGGKLVINPTTVVDIQGNLDVTGDINADFNITAYAASDRRLKDNITPLTTPLIKISKIGGYEFDWNENQSSYEGHDVGVIAQEIKEVVPEIVTERNDGYLAVRYEKLVPLLIEGIKELTDRVEKLEEENKKLKEK